MKQKTKIAKVKIQFYDGRYCEDGKNKECPFMDFSEKKCLLYKEELNWSKEKFKCLFDPYIYDDDHILERCKKCIEENGG